LRLFRPGLKRQACRPFGFKKNFRNEFLSKLFFASSLRKNKEGVWFLFELNIYR